MGEIGLIGAGSGRAESLTEEAAAFLAGADLVIGAPRLLNDLEKKEGRRELALTKPEEILAALEDEPGRTAILFSGDTGFFSGAKRLIAALTDRGLSYRVFPGLSSLAMLCGAIGESYEDVETVSLHGRARETVALQKAVLSAVLTGKKCFFLCDNVNTPGMVLSVLEGAGLSALQVCVGEDLGLPDQRLSRGTVSDLLQNNFTAISVVLTAGVQIRQGPRVGIPDASFVRGAVPMTKHSVRALILSALSLTGREIVWDIGGGAGSVSVEAALALPEGLVYSVEREEEGLALMRANRDRFSCYNMIPVFGEAPEALSDLPAPDAVFIGGSGGCLKEIVAAVRMMNPVARIVLTTVTAETFAEAVSLFREQGLPYEVQGISVTSSEAAGKYHLMKAENQIFLFSAGGKQ